MLGQRSRGGPHQRGVDKAKMLCIEVACLSLSADLGSFGALELVERGRPMGTQR